MKVYMNTGGIAATNSFLIADENARKAILIDAPNDTTGMLLDEAHKRGWDVIALWLTHGHFDHLADHALVTSRFPSAKVVIHELDEPKLQDPNTLFRELFGVAPFHIPPRKADVLLHGGEKLKLGELEFEVVPIPGHSAGQVAYYCAAENVIAAGDLIIAGSVGRTDLPDSDEDQHMDSIRRVMTLPGETRLLPGHGQPTTLAHEAATNPFVRSAMRNA